MTGNTPPIGSAPFVMPALAAVASAGVTAIIVRQLYGYPQIPAGIPGPAVSWLSPMIAAVLVTATAAVVAMLPWLGRAGGWPIVAAGLATSVAVILTAGTWNSQPVAMTWLFVVITGFGVSLGGVLVAAAQAPVAEQVAIAAGLTFGLVAERLIVDVLTPDGPETIDPVGRMLPFYVVLGLAVVAVGVTFTRPVPAHAERRRAEAVPVLVVIGVAGLIQAGHYVRRVVVDEFRLSHDGLASQRRIDVVGAFEEYSAIALAVVAGVILLWLGYRRGKASLARWVVLGFALGAPGMAVVFGFSYGTAREPTAIALVAAVGIATGIFLAVRADRFFAWETLGVAAAAIGMILGSVAYRVGPQSSTLAGLLIAGGFAFALSAGLTRALRTAAGTAGHTAVSLSLGLVTMLLVANAIAPATWMALGSSGFGGFELSVPITSLLASFVILLLFGFGRAVERVRREIREQAAAPQQ